MGERVPAECFPVGHHLACEMAARGWSPEDVAARMSETDRDVWTLTVDLLVECSDEPGIVLDVDTAQRLGRAFDTSADLWIDLHRSYIEWRAKQHSTEDSA